ncbi:helix-turn-helix domain-containing protein [Flagellimonas meishanensis]|uniref:helix-turn-helix domain-containing protein n=1 Tax=Flagellimonas meishanensis TaxID=2873264 RepID=UPI001CA65020|nr:helix-turn-helix transcriptional regulator [[Muricauda] meishanensis]
MKILKKGSYYGTKRSELQNDGFVLSEYGYHAPETDWHYHENPYFMFVLEGNLKDINRKGTNLCPPGSFIFHNWQDIHKNTKETQYAKGFHIELDSAWFNEKSHGPLLWEGSTLLTDPRLYQIFLNIYSEFHINDDHSGVSLDCLMLQLCNELCDISEVKLQRRPQWVGKLQEIIYDDPMQVTLKSLSDILGIHPVHLSRSVPKYLDTTLGDYIRRSKLRRSFHLLIDSKHSLTEIAYLCGFADQSHFTRSFKQYFNKTPKSFRRQLGGC